jgi:hypothetical protein
LALYLDQEARNPRKDTRAGALIRDGTNELAETCRQVFRFGTAPQEVVTMRKTGKWPQNIYYTADRFPIIPATVNPALSPPAAPAAVDYQKNGIIIPR